MRTLTAYRQQLLAVLGAVAFVAGVWLLCPPLALMLSGAGLFAAAWYGARCSPRIDIIDVDDELGAQDDEPDAGPPLRLAR